MPARSIRIISQNNSSVLAISVDVHFKPIIERGSVILTLSCANDIKFHWLIDWEDYGRRYTVRNCWPSTNTKDREPVDICFCELDSIKDYIGKFMQNMGGNYLISDAILTLLEALYSPDIEISQSDERNIVIVINSEYDTPGSVLHTQRKALEGAIRRRQDQ